MQVCLGQEYVELEALEGKSDVRLLAQPFHVNLTTCKMLTVIRLLLLAATAQASVLTIVSPHFLITSSNATQLRSEPFVHHPYLLTSHLSKLQNLFVEKAITSTNPFAHRYPQTHLPSRRKRYQKRCPTPPDFPPIL
jgi:hypothetical protein